MHRTVAPLVDEHRRYAPRLPSAEPVVGQYDLRSMCVVQRAVANASKPSRAGHSQPVRLHERLRFAFQRSEAQAEANYSKVIASACAAATHADLHINRRLDGERLCLGCSAVARVQTMPARKIAPVLIYAPRFVCARPTPPVGWAPSHDRTRNQLSKRRAHVTSERAAQWRRFDRSCPDGARGECGAAGRSGQRLDGGSVPCHAIAHRRPIALGGAVERKEHRRARPLVGAVRQPQPQQPRVARRSLGARTAGVSLSGVFLFDRFS